MDRQKEPQSPLWRAHKRGAAADSVWDIGPSDGCMGKRDTAFSVPEKLGGLEPDTVCYLCYVFPKHSSSIRRSRLRAFTDKLTPAWALKWPHTPSNRREGVSSKTKTTWARTPYCLVTPGGTEACEPVQSPPLRLRHPHTAYQ